jgi:SP family arabinose:H+ symporter-like MFS transporter
MAGVKLKDGLFNAVMVQLVFFLSTFIAIVLIDKIGRKILMLAGTGLMAFSLICLALVFHLEISGGIFVLVLMMIYIGSFGFTLGPVVWVLISEMFPSEIRGKAIAMTSAVLWLVTFIIVLISPWLLNIGASTNFMVFGILNILGFIFCYKYLPETKGKTLEQMNSIWLKEEL